MKRLFTLFALCTIVNCFPSAQETDQTPIPKRKYFTQRIQGAAPSIDGHISDSCWDAVQWSGDYTQFDPDEGKPPSQETAFKILYDQENLYLAFRCFDTEPEKIVKRMSRRDNFPGDWIEFNIDSYHDQRSAFSFTVSVSGVKGDEFVSNNGNNWDSNWNPIWYTKTQIDDEGWTAEIKIPFSQLRFGQAAELVWGIQSTRRNFRKEERSLWQRVRRNESGWVSRFGELHGLKNIQPKRQVEIQPYVLSQAKFFESEPGNPFADGKDFSYSVGLDGKIGITNDLTLDFTINPDFGQVEADPSALTLDGFQIFFDERRPFFIENRNIFNYQLTAAEAGGPFNSDLLFYSRRIGGSPHRYIDNDPERGYFVKQPDNTTILGAAKFSGKTSKGLSIGILESITQRETATIREGQNSNEAIVEPRSNYFVGRVQQDINEGNTVIGGIFTAVNRKIDDTALEFLPDQAYSGGIDFTHRWKDQTWFVTGNAVFSNIQGSKEAIQDIQTSFEHLFQRPDAEHLQVDSNATALTGHGGTVKLGKLGGKWIFEGGVTWRSPELELNDLGFMINADETNAFFWGARRWQKPFSVFRRLQVNYNLWSRWDFGGNNLYEAINSNAHATFNNFWNIGAGLTYEFKDISKNHLRGGPTIRRNNGVANWVYVNSDSRKNFTVGVNLFQAYGLEKAVRYYEASLWSNLQATDAISISLSPNYAYNHREDQYVTDVDFENEKRYITSEVLQHTFSMTLRLNYNITPDLTIQYYGQPFISKGNYSDFKKATDTPLAKAFYDRYQRLPSVTYDEKNEQYLVDENENGTIDYSFDDPDFNFIQFRSNLVLRWEYIPGSEFYFVWSQGLTTTENPEQNLVPSLWNNLSQDLFGDKGTNIFLVKATYRFIR